MLENILLGMNIMSGNFFLDTNIFVYTFDHSAPVKQKKALHLIERALTSGAGVISYQVIQEFLNVSTRKFQVPLRVFDAKTYLEEILLPLCTVYSSPELYHYALDIHDHSQFSFYDSLIVAGAIRAGCSTLYSEDMQHGRKIGPVKIINPFV